MNSTPTEKQIKQALMAAAKAHHEFEENYLGGVRHEQWPYWYAAFILGKLGDFISPAKLTQLIEKVTDQDHWYSSAARLIFENTETF